MPLHHIRWLATEGSDRAKPYSGVDHRAALTLGPSALCWEPANAVLGFPVEVYSVIPPTTQLRD